MIADTDLDLSNQGRFQARTFLRYSLMGALKGEMGITVGRLIDTNYKADILPAIDHRFLLGLFSDNINFHPYAYVGGGFFRYDIRQFPDGAADDSEVDGWTGVIPAGLGFSVPVGEKINMDLSGGYNYTFSDALEGITENKDAYWSVLLGFTGIMGSVDKDSDGDGLLNSLEKELGTDHKNADSDDDGLGDGEEHNQYKTNPMRADSDGDKLKDGDEVKSHKTNPLKPDTDGDGLSDSAEINDHKTNPTKADSDSDGLDDRAEVETHPTEPLKADTDGDGLNDGAEINQHKTDPMKTDSDGDTLSD
ncbi:MAG: OmpA family protein, partial [FCB group bacterium]|nr:OmpA family protein [FCB group bacterium]